MDSRVNVLSVGIQAVQVCFPFKSDVERIKGFKSEEYLH